MHDAFAHPFLYWVGMTTLPGTEQAAVDEFSQFYTHTHLPEVLASNPGFRRATRYQLIGPDPRGDRGPGWLAIYELDSDAAAQGYVQRNDGPPEGRPKYTPGPPAWQSARRDWRHLWRRISSRGAADDPPYAIYMVGMNVPPGTDAAGLAQFNEFYTQTHVPEVLDSGGYARGTRFELERDFNAPASSCPRFCAIYEADQASAEALLARMSGADRQPAQRPLSAGPDVWQRHDTLWRLVYRRVGDPLEAGSTSQG